MSKFVSPKIAGAEILPVKMAIYVPSTIKDRSISQEQWQKRIQQTVKFLNIFGGSTRERGTGSWNSGQKVIDEQVMIVESFAKVKDYNKAKKSIVRWLKSKKKEWGQIALSFEFEDDLILVK
jgi:hypothetical protein